VAHGAIGIQPHGFLECAQCFVVPEAVNQGKALVEPLLGLRRFGRDRDVSFADAVDPLWRGKCCGMDVFGL